MYIDMCMCVCVCYADPLPAKLLSEGTEKKKANQWMVQR